MIYNFLLNTYDYACNNACGQDYKSLFSARTGPTFELQYKVYTAHLSKSIMRFIVHGTGIRKCLLRFNQACD